MGLLSALVGARMSQINQRHQDQREDTQLQRLVEDANKAGINPLSALGGASYAGGGGQQDFAGLGSEIGAGLEAMFPNKRDREGADLEMRRLRAETATAEADSLIASQAARSSLTNPSHSRIVDTPGNTPYAAGGVGIPDPFADVNDPYIVRENGRVKVGPNGAPMQYLYLPYVDGNGETVMMVNPNSPDADQAAAAITSHGYAEVKDAVAPSTSAAAVEDYMRADAEYFEELKKKRKKRAENSANYEYILTGPAM